MDKFGMITSWSIATGKILVNDAGEVQRVPSVLTNEKLKEYSIY